MLLCLCRRRHRWQWLGRTSHIVGCEAPPKSARMLSVAPTQGQIEEFTLYWSRAPHAARWPGLADWTPTSLRILGNSQALLQKFS